MLSASTLDDITGVILAGGPARRMGSMDKGLVQLCGKPLIEHVIAAMKLQVGRLMVSANRNLNVYAAYGYPVLPDLDGDYYGPLAGMLSAMHAADTPFILSVPCDAPSVPADLVERLFATLTTEDTDVCVVHDGALMQPVFALLRCTLLDDLRKYLESGGREVMRWMQDQSAALADFSDKPSTFLNINTTQDLQDLERKMQWGEIC